MPKRTRSSTSSHPPSSSSALRHCLGSPSGARNELERCGSRFRGEDGADDAGGVPAVLGAVGGVDLVAQVVRLDEENILPDAAGLDPCFVAILGALEPRAGAPVHGSDVEIVAEADDPDRRWVSQSAVGSE